MTFLTRKISVLGPRSEVMNLLWPLVLLIFLIVCWVTELPMPTGHKRQFLVFISSSVFLDVLHQAFTLFLLMKIPEIQNWINARKVKEGVNPLLTWSLFFLLLCSVSFAFFTLVLPASRSVFRIFVDIIVLTTAHHLSKQYMGFSMLYNRSLLSRHTLTSAEGQKLLRCEKRERILFFPYIFVLLSRVLIVSTPYFLTDGFDSLRLILIFLSFLLPTAIVVNSWLYPHANQSNKSLYLLRLYILPIGLMIPGGRIATVWVHGFEYAFIFYKMCDNSSIKRTRALAATLSLYLLFFMILLIPNPRAGLRWLVGPIIGNRWYMLDLLASLAAAFTFLHYIVDRSLFRLSDPVTRKFVGPLLKNSRDGSGASSEAETAKLAS